MLGGLLLEREGSVVTRFRTRKTAELLAYLAYYCERSHPRETLIDLLWPESSIESGRHSLSMAISSLRPLLEPQGSHSYGTVLIADHFTVRLNPLLVTTDVSDIEKALKSAGKQEREADRIPAYCEAVELYSGEFLTGYYADWIFPEQQRLEELFFYALRQLIACLEKSGEIERALTYALRAASVAQMREEAHHEVIRLYLSAGRPDALRQKYRELEQLLQSEAANDMPPPPGTPLAPVGSSLLKQAGLERAGTPERSTGALSPAPSPVALIRSPQLEPVGGAVPIESRYYVNRAADGEFGDAITRRDSIVLVKGARQNGKTSLLARGLQQARDLGCNVVLTHFQVFNAQHFQSANTMLLALAEHLAEQLDLQTLPTAHWEERLGANLNFRRYLRREVLNRLTEPLVWGMDGIDFLFPYAFSNEVFGLFRSWHDERALDPGGPWAKLTLAIAYSTEAHLFISDGNQSPFNVGTRLTLEDFTLEQVSDLNRRYGSPLNPEELRRYFRVVAGQPYLVRRGLHEMVTRNVRMPEFERRADSEDWIFGEHLRRLALMLGRESPLLETVRGLLEGRSCASWEHFYRLRSAGILTGDSSLEARFRCPLYATFLKRHLS